MVRVKAKNPKTGVAYLRASTAGQGQSTADQKAAIRAWAKREGITITSWHTDLGVSGGKGLEDRPALLSALESIASSSAGLLVVAKRDRLARDVMASGFIELNVKRRGARIVSIAGEGTDGDTPQDLMMRGIVDVFAQFEKNVIQARTKAALAAKKSRGELCGKAMYGYMVEPTVGDVKGTQLIEHGKEMEALIRLVLLRKEGLSIRKIAVKLTDEGFRSRRGTDFSWRTVQEILGKRIDADGNLIPPAWKALAAVEAEDGDDWSGDDEESAEANPAEQSA